MIQIPDISISSQFTQECLVCHLPLRAGELSEVGALNCFTYEPVWMHSQCAHWYRQIFGDRTVLDDGWRVATMHQTCTGCGHHVVTGDMIHRRLIFPQIDGIKPVLVWICHHCWRQDHPAHVR